MNLFNKKISNSFEANSVIKIIAGLNNNQINSIIKLVKSLELLDIKNKKNIYIDIIANPRIVSMLKAMTDIPICVSSIDALELQNCITAGADMVEIGNFDAFYSKNIILSYDNILNLSIEIRQLVSNNDICVTIPHYLSLNQQVKLAQNLEKIGINLLQTEGCHTNQDKHLILSKDPVSIATAMASTTLASTYVLSKSVNLPIITSSSINSISSSIAKFYGASGIGIGKAITKYNNIVDISNYLNEILYCIKDTHSSYSDGNIFSLYNSGRHNYLNTSVSL